MINIKIAVDRTLGVRLVIIGWILLLAGFILPNLAPSWRLALFIVAAVTNGAGLVILLLKK